MQTVLGIILGGGAGSRLYPLTKKRAKPAVPLGANYRLIDIPVSNCINSNVNKIYCLTQFNSASLNRHLSQAYNANVGGYSSRGFVEVPSSPLALSLRGAAPQRDGGGLLSPAHQDSCCAVKGHASTLIERAIGIMDSPAACAAKAWMAWMANPKL